VVVIDVKFMQGSAIYRIYYSSYNTLRGYEVYRKLHPLLGGLIILEGMIFMENFQISRGYYYFRGYVSRKLPKGPLGTSFREGTFIP